MAWVIFSKAIANICARSGLNTTGQEQDVSTVSSDKPGHGVIWCDLFRCANWLLYSYIFLLNCVLFRYIYIFLYHLILSTCFSMFLLILVSSKRFLFCPRNYWRVRQGQNRNDRYILPGDLRIVFWFSLHSLRQRCRGTLKPESCLGCWASLGAKAWHVQWVVFIRKLIGHWTTWTKTWKKNIKQETMKNKNLQHCYPQERSQVIATAVAEEAFFKQRCMAVGQLNGTSKRAVKRVVLVKNLETSALLT